MDIAQRVYIPYILRTYIRQEHTAMRLLTHNVLKNNSADAKGNGYPLKLINVISVRVDNTSNQIDTATSTKADNNDDQDSNGTIMKIEFMKGILPTLHWSALVQVRIRYPNNDYQHLDMDIHWTAFQYLPEFFFLDRQRRPWGL
jgi:hypothetical protein